MTLAGPALRRTVGAVAVLAVCGLCAACAASTPLCDKAAGLASAGALDQATDNYAQAAKNGEGECASVGLNTAGVQYADAYENVELGRSEERSGDLAGALSAYQAALQLDQSNAAALEATTRLNGPAPQLQAEPEPPAEVPGEPRIGLIVLVTAAATAAASVLLILTGWGLWKWRRRETDRAEVERLSSAITVLDRTRTDMDGARGEFATARTGLEEARQAVENHVTAVGEARQQLLDNLAALRTSIDDAKRTLGGDADQRAAELQVYLEELADYVAERMGDPQSVPERFTAANGVDPDRKGRP